MPAVVVDTLVLAGAADGAALGAAVAFAGLIPPCPEHAPRPGLLVDPSTHVTEVANVFVVAFAAWPPRHRESASLRPLRMPVNTPCAWTCALQGDRYDSDCRAPSPVKIWSEYHRGNVT
jgi:hypothetical protein